MNTTLTEERVSKSKEPKPQSVSEAESQPSLGTEHVTNYEAWVAKAPKQPMTLETVDPGPFGAEDVEIVVEHCGLCHSDVSVLNNEWGFSQFPAVLGHEVIGRVTAIGPNAKGLKVGQRVGVGWNAASCMYRFCKCWKLSLIARAGTNGSS